MGERRGRWFLKEPPADVRARVFLLPYSGCGASMYRQWPAVHEGIGFSPVQLPGRENRLREPHFGTYEALADVLADELRPYLDRPYALFGHCSSALAAYETAVRVTQRGYPPPARLYVSSEVAPQDGPYGLFLELDDEGLLRELAALMQGMGATPSPTFLDMALGVLRADVEANRRYYSADPYVLPCPITAIGWAGDTGMPPHRMSGWAACGDTTAVVLDGDHYRFVQAPGPLLRLLVDGIAEREERGADAGLVVQGRA